MANDDESQPPSVAPLAPDLARTTTASMLRERIPKWRKWTTLFVICWMALPVTFSSCSLMAATPEIASDFSTEPAVISLGNAGVLLAMAFSTLIWGPITVLLGRRKAYIVALELLRGASMGVALSPNLAVFTFFCVLGGSTGPFFLITGQVILADIFEPVGLLVDIFSN